MMNHFSLLNILKQLLIYLRHFLVTTKFYLVRGREWLSFVQATMIGMLFLKYFEHYIEHFLGLNTKESIAIFLIMTFVLIILFGWLEVRYVKGYKEDLFVQYRENPFFPITVTHGLMMMKLMEQKLSAEELSLFKQELKEKRKNCVDNPQHYLDIYETWINS